VPRPKRAAVLGRGDLALGAQLDVADLVADAGADGGADRADRRAGVDGGLRGQRLGLRAGLAGDQGDRGGCAREKRPMRHGEPPLPLKTISSGAKGPPRPDYQT
jgi:hypothetical protein